MNFILGGGSIMFQRQSPADAVSRAGSHVVAASAHILVRFSEKSTLQTRVDILIAPAGHNSVVFTVFQMAFRLLSFLENVVGFILRYVKAKHFVVTASMGFAASDAFGWARGGVPMTATSVLVKFWVDGALEVRLNCLIAPRSHDSVLLTVSFMKAPTKDARHLYRIFQVGEQFIRVIMRSNRGRKGQ
jgi:hypothetical protein